MSRTDFDRLQNEVANAPVAITIVVRRPAID